MKKITFVIPCYRSEHTLENVVRELKERLKEREDDYDYEIILVNDASPDGVWRVIQKLCKEDTAIIGISFARNFGQHAALLAGYAKATGDYVFSLDDDGQAPLEAIYDMVDKLEEGYDVVYGKYPDVKQSGFRRLGSYMNDKMSEILLGKPKHIEGNSFSVMRAFITKEIIRYKNAYPYIGGLVFRATKNIANVTVNQRERQSGTSGYTFKKLISLWMNGFTAFSIKPLQMVTFFGSVVACLGFLYMIAILIRRILEPQILLGWSSIMAVLLILGGVILVALGMIGEYIGRIYISINDAPQYVIREEIIGTREEEHDSGKACDK